MAEIERIAQELRAYNKRDLPATKDQVEALVKLAERDRPLVLNVNSEAVAKQLIGKVDQQAKAFQDTGYQLINYLDDRQKALTTALDERVAALKAAEASLQATAQQIPRSIPLNVFENWRSTVGFTLGPVVLILLTMLCTGHFSRVPKADLEKVQAENEQLRQYNARLSKEGTFYLDQIKSYRAKFPKTAASFPKYVAPPIPAPAAE
jgi:hypothetical protein